MTRRSRMGTAPEKKLSLDVIRSAIWRWNSRPARSTTDASGSLGSVAVNRYTVVILHSYDSEQHAAMVEHTLRRSTRRALDLDDEILGANPQESPQLSISHATPHRLRTYRHLSTGDHS